MLTSNQIHKLTTISGFFY